MILELQKNVILTMRQQGSSYRKIAERLMMSPNTVKTICRRSNMKPAQPTMSTRGICKNCGAPLPPNVSGRRRIFCSDKCRYAWWNRTRCKQPYRLTCYHCGKEFISYGNRKRKFCGRECYILSRYGEGLP